MKPFDILVVGELNADLIVRGDVTPRFGQAETLVDDATLVLGGSSAIFACGAARLGLRVAFAGVVGDDELGRFVLRRLEAHGVDTGAVRVDGALRTGLSIILSRPADRAILTHLGSISALGYDMIDRRLLDRARHLHLGSYFLLEQLKPDAGRLFAAAQLRGLSTSLDTNYDPGEHWQGLEGVFPHVDVFLPNRTELLAIAGTDDLDLALRKLAGKVPLVAVKLGEQGALARRGEELLRAESIAVDVVDTTGAGDSFDAGFVYGFLAGWDVGAALRLGCVTGALSTRAAGGTGAQAGFDEAARWL